MKKYLKFTFVLLFTLNLQSQSGPSFINFIRDVTVLPSSVTNYSIQTIPTSDSVAIRLDFKYSSLDVNFLLNVLIGNAQDSSDVCIRVFKFVQTNNVFSMQTNSNSIIVPCYLNAGILSFRIKVPISVYSNIKWLTIYTTNKITLQNFTKSYYQF